jgi:hypothetical protein
MLTPPDFDQTTYAYFIDESSSTGNTFTAQIGPITDPPAICNVFWAMGNAGNGTLSVAGNGHVFDGCLYSNDGMTLGTGSISTRRSATSATSPPARTPSTRRR